LYINTVSTKKTLVGYLWEPGLVEDRSPGVHVDGAEEVGLQHPEGPVKIGLLSQTSIHTLFRYKPTGLLQA
jgi:hypothetical protein